MDYPLNNIFTRKGSRKVSGRYRNLTLVSLHQSPSPDLNTTIYWAQIIAVGIFTTFDSVYSLMFITSQVQSSQSLGVKRLINAQTAAT